MTAATPVGALQKLHIVGLASANQKNYESAVHTLLQMRTKWPTLSPIPGWHDGTFFVSATPAAAPIIKRRPIRHGFLAAHWRHRTVCDYCRTNQRGVQRQIRLVSQTLPDGITSAVAEEGDKFTITLTGAANVPPAAHSIVFGTYGTFGGRQQIARVSLPLEVNDPLSLNIGPAVQVKPGTAQKLKIQLMRRGSDRQPVTVSFQGLPAGVTIPDATIAADQDSIEVDVTAAATTAAGNYDGLQVNATSQYAGQPTTAGAKLTITVPAP